MYRRLAGPIVTEIRFGKGAQIWGGKFVNIIFVPVESYFKQWSTIISVDMIHSRREGLRPTQATLLSHSQRKTWYGWQHKDQTV